MTLIIEWLEHGPGTMTCDRCGIGTTIQPDRPYLAQTTSFEVNHRCPVPPQGTGSHDVDP